MHRITPLFWIGLLAGLPAMAQPELHAPVALTEQSARELGADMINQFQVTTSSMNSCPMPDISGILSQFDDTATIEVSSLNGPTRYYRPADYFIMVNGLKCGGDPQYTEMNFGYRPVFYDEAYSSRVGSSWMVRFKITQLFMAKKNGKTAYSDYTIKWAILHIWRNSKGIIEGKILRIFVDKTTKIPTSEHV